MGRPSKKAEIDQPSISKDNIEELQAVGVQVPGVETKPENEEPVVETKPENDIEISQKVLDLMKLYSHYEEIWVTEKGFVHHKNAPAYLTKGATLYKNKYYNK